MNNIRLNKSVTEVAQEWNELTLHQLLELVRLLFSVDLKVTQSQWSYAVLYQLLNIKWYNVRFLWNFLHLPKDMIVTALFPLTEFVKKENTLTDFKLTSFRIWFTKYYAPADELNNLTIDEFRFCEPFYVGYKKDKDMDCLDGLIAVLYRKKRKEYYPKAVSYNGDVRQDFNENLIVQHSKKVSKLSLRKKQLIYLTYEGARNKIINECPHLFRNDEDKKQGRDFGMSGLILELSGAKFGTFDETCKVKLKTAFNLLEMEAQKINNRKTT